LSVAVEIKAFDAEKFPVDKVDRNPCCAMIRFVDSVEKEPIDITILVAEKLLAIMDEAVSTVVMRRFVESVEIKAFNARRVPVETVEIFPTLAFNVFTEKLEKTPRGILKVPTDRKFVLIDDINTEEAKNVPVEMEEKKPFEAMIKLGVITVEKYPMAPSRIPVEIVRTTMEEIFALLATKKAVDNELIKALSERSLPVEIDEKTPPLALTVLADTLEKIARGITIVPTDKFKTFTVEM
jgi:hypothetical protein